MWFDSTNCLQLAVPAKCQLLNGNVVFIVDIVVVVVVVSVVGCAVVGFVNGDAVVDNDDGGNVDVSVADVVGKTVASVPMERVVGVVVITGCVVVFCWVVTVSVTVCVDVVSTVGAGVVVT